MTISLPLNFSLSLFSSPLSPLSPCVRMHHRLGHHQSSRRRDVQLLVASRTPVSCTQRNNGWPGRGEIFCAGRDNQPLQHRSGSNECGSAIRELHGRRPSSAALLAPGSARSREKKGTRGSESYLRFVSARLSSLSERDEERTWWEEAETHIKRIVAAARAVGWPKMLS